MTKEIFNKEKEEISKQYVNILKSHFNRYEWSKFIERGSMYMHHPTIKGVSALYGQNDILINPYENSDTLQDFLGKRRIIIERIKQFYDKCLSFEEFKWNYRSLTLYPSGEYESEFIWYSEAYLDTLKTGATSWFRFIYEKACERVQDRCGQLPASYPALVEMTVTFDTLGISQPALFHAENNPKMTFKLHLEQLYFFNERPYEEIFAEYDAIREPEKGDITRANQKHYKMMNEGELKGVFPRWNKLTFTIDPNRVYISSEEVMERLKFEWLPENEA